MINIGKSVQDDLFVLEYNKKQPCPFHIQEYKRRLKCSEQSNKSWKIILIGSLDDCFNKMKEKRENLLGGVI